MGISRCEVLFLVDEQVAKALRSHANCGKPHSYYISLLTLPIHDMRTSFPIIVSIVVLPAFASPANVHYVVHERRDAEISDWIPKAVEVDRSAILPLSIALTQRNLEKGQDFLMDVSDPFSPN
jgi:hypothetical protein